MAHHLGSRNPESTPLRSGASVLSAPRPEDWDYPTVEIPAEAMRAKIAELRSKRGAG